MVEATYESLAEGANKARAAGEEIAQGAKKMFAELGEYAPSLQGSAGQAFVRVQGVMNEKLVVIDRALDSVAEGIDSSNLTLDSQDQDGSAAIEATVDGSVKDLLAGK